MHKSITLERIESLVREQMFDLANPGICTNCGEDADDCEPDARNYPCDVCGENQVFGAEELLFLV